MAPGTTSRPLLEGSRKDRLAGGIRRQWGQRVVNGGGVMVAPEEMMDIALPIAGLMSPVSGHEVAFRTLCIQEKVREIGCQMKSPFITMAFMCLPVIPDIKITDRHLMDTKTFSAIY